MLRRRVIKLSLWKTPIAFFLLAWTLLPACGGSFYDKVNKVDRLCRGKIDSNKVFVAADFDKHRPLSVAILPLENLTKEKEATDLLQRLLYNNFSSLSYHDIELAVVNNKLADFSTDNIFETIDPSKVGKMLGADGLVVGKVTAFESLYVGVYASITIGVEVKMLDAETGQVLWTVKHKETTRSGGVPLSPVGAIITAASSALNLSRYHFVNTANQLCQTVVETIPPSANFKGKSFPKIYTLAHNGMKRLLKKGDRLEVGIEGTPGLNAVFTIRPQKTSIRMEEQEAGIYTGTYVVREGNALIDGVIAVRLSDMWGNVSMWEDTLGYINVDGVSPPSPTGIRVTASNCIIRLRWNPSGARDVVRYYVWRSTTPLTGYRQIECTEFTRFEDKNVHNYTTYYYRITASDRAGNTSQPMTGVVATPVLPGPTIVAGRIEDDAVWHPGAIPYHLKGELIVPRESTLTINPGVVVVAHAGSRLIVRGILDLRGEKNAPVVFAPPDEGESWQGIFFDQSSDRCRLSHFVVRGAKVGLKIIESSPQMVKGTIKGCNTGIHVKGDRAAPVLDDLTVYKNKITGIEVTDMARPRIIRCRIAYNGEVGIKIDQCTANVLTNEISFNKVGVVLSWADALVGGNKIVNNLRASLIIKNIGDQAPKVDLNYFGSPEKIRIFSSQQGIIGNAVVVLETKDYRGPSRSIPIKPYPTSMPQSHESLVVVVHSDDIPQIPVIVSGTARRSSAAPIIDAKAALSKSMFDAFIEGISAVRKGDYVKAIPLLEKAKTEKTREAASRFWLGFCYLDTGQVKKAILNYHTASKLEPDNVNYLLHLGMALHIAGRRSDAETVYREILLREPNNMDARSSLKMLHETPDSKQFK